MWTCSLLIKIISLDCSITSTKTGMNVCTVNFDAFYVLSEMSGLVVFVLAYLLNNDDVNIIRLYPDFTTIFFSLGFDPTAPTWNK